MARKRVASTVQHSSNSNTYNVDTSFNQPTKTAVAPATQPSKKQRYSNGLTISTSLLSPIAPTPSIASPKQTIKPITTTKGVTSTVFTSSTNSPGQYAFSSPTSATTPTTPTATAALNDDHQMATGTTRHLACDACRRRKVKCDSVKPTCSCCQRYNLTCHYQTEIRKRGSRANYVAQLEKRLQWMEQLLQTHPSAPGYAQTFPSSTEPISPELSSVFKPSSYQQQNGDYRLQLPEVDDQSQNVEAPPALRDHLIQLYFRFMAPHFYLLDRKTFMQRIASLSSSTTTSIENGDNTTISHNEHSTTALLYSVLAVAARFAQLPNVSTKERHMAGQAYANRSIFALKACQPSVSQRQSPLNLTTLQALINLCIHASGGGMDYLNHTAKAHALLLHTECTRMAIRLNLHLLDEQPLPGNEIQTDSAAVLEEKRRAWWCCFMLNQLSAMSSGKPVSIDEFTFQVAYSFLEKKDGATSHGENNPSLSLSDGLPGQIYIPRLLVILGRVIRFVNRPRPISTSGSSSLITKREQETAQQLEQELAYWYSHQLPASLQGCPDIPLAVDPTERDHQLATVSTHITLLCLYYTALMLLSRSILVPHPQHNYRYRVETELDRRSLDAYRQSAILLTGLTNRLTGDALLYQHPIMAYSLWTASMLWIHDKYTSPSSSTAWEALNQLHSICTLLNQLGVVWEHANYLEQLLKLMLDPFTQSNKKINNGNNKSMKLNYDYGCLPVKSYCNFISTAATTTKTTKTTAAISTAANTSTTLAALMPISTSTFQPIKQPAATATELSTVDSFNLSYYNTLTTRPIAAQQHVPSLLQSSAIDGSTTALLSKSLLSNEEAALLSLSNWQPITQQQQQQPSSTVFMPNMVSAPIYNIASNLSDAKKHAYNTNTNTTCKDKQLKTLSTDADPMTDFTLLAGQSLFSLDADPRTLASTLGTLLRHDNNHNNGCHTTSGMTSMDGQKLVYKSPQSPSTPSSMTAATSEAMLMSKTSEPTSSLFDLSSLESTSLSTLSSSWQIHGLIY
ncbi:fungal-specific transcription factor domain-containing protein [Syncephalis fuscata]|nr:fungal-specific transcription factor domain-containing protein [Syncephalis fuscata]